MDADARGVTNEAAAKKGPTVVSVLNLKGGVGKTTVAALLARYASGVLSGLITRMDMIRAQIDGVNTIDGLKVLAIDLDPQANLSQALMGEPQYKRFMDEKKPSIVELFNGFIPTRADNFAPTPVRAQEVIQNVNSINLDIIPSRFDFSDNLINSVRTDDTVIARFIAQEMAHKDLIIIDCAPTESILTRAAYHASRYVLIPVRTEFFATIGFPLMKESLDSFRRQNRGHQIDVCGVLINRNRTIGAPMGPHHVEALADIESHAREYEWPILCYIDHSDGYPKLAKDPFALHLGNAAKQWPPVAEEILRSIGFNGQETR